MKSAYLPLLLLLCAGTLLASPDWEKGRLSVEPGVGTEHFQLGLPLPQEWPDKLGPPDHQLNYHGTGERLQRFTWGEVARGQLVRGLTILSVGVGEESNIVDIEIKRIRAGVDGENLFLGLPEANISKRSKLVQKDGKRSYLLPGLAIETEGGKMVGLRVYSPAATRWRFQRWRVRPGIAAGPIKLGEKIDDSLFQTIGEPHQKSRERLVWQADDSNQALQVTLDPRTQTVTRIKGVGLPWRTPNGVTLGDSQKKFQDKHQGAKSQMGRGMDDIVMKLPGMRANFAKGKLQSFDIYPLPR